MPIGPDGKLAPDPRGEERHFYDAAAEGHVGICRCRACGRFFLPRAVCPFCWTEEPEEVHAAGTGTVHSFTVLHRAGMPGFEADVPYVVGLVELDEGVRLISNLVGVEPGDVSIGLPVRARFESRGGVPVPLFEPA